MSQHDYAIADAPGATFRGDVNDALGAIVSQNSGASAPATTFAYMWWADTTTGLLKQRNAANTGWITLGALADLGIQSGAQTWASGSGTDTYTATLSPAPTAYVTGALYRTTLANANTSTTPTLNLNSLGAKTIKKNARGGKAALAAGDISAAHECLFEYDGTDMILLNPAPVTVVTLGTAVASTSGTSIDFTGIPAGTKQILISFSGVSLSSTSDILVQLGDSGGFETSGYVSATATAAGNNSSTAGFVLRMAAAANVAYGHMLLTLCDAAAFQWVSSHAARIAATTTCCGGGDKALSAELTQVRITTVSGSDTFDAGKINISYTL